MPERPESDQRFERTGIAGWLLLPALAIIFQPIGFVARNYEKYREGVGMGATRFHVNYPVLAVDLVLLTAVALVGYLFFKKKRVAPAGFVVYALFGFCLWNYTDAFLTQLAAPVTATLFHCLVLVPYLVFSRRVQSTFTAGLDQAHWMERRLQPLAPRLEAFYGWLRRRRGLVIPGMLLFVVVNTLLYALLRAVFVLHDASQFLQLLS